MTTLLTNLLLLLACTAAVFAFKPQSQRPVNTIFGDEKLEGQIFENIDSKEIFNNVATRDDDNPYRLPTTTKPNRYRIMWATDFTNFAIAGTVAIELEATQANVSEIYIHSEDLFITSATLVQGTSNIAVNMIEQPEYQFLRFQLLTGTLQYSATNPIVYTLTISFEGSMRTDMSGIYRSWYKNNNATRWMATTQYQATSARKAFPCYDEPSFKAYVDITIRRPTTYRSWSNMRIAETTNSAVIGFQEDRYYTTPYMSTYLLAIIVAEYDSLDVYNQNNQLIYEVIARPEAIGNGQGQYALEVGQELLATMSAHTGFDFFAMDPNLKMTQAAIPDFSAGAMENWGLLTYREAYLMYDEEHTNGYFKQLIAYILSHEIAHMWFGNLVTCDWWDVLWLNEGFARYYQYFLTHWVEDYMGLETRFINEQMHTSLLSDSVNTHALSNPGVGSPAAVSAMFSTISYNKGAAIIRMTEHLLGFEVHRQGLQNYLANNAFATALPITLFQSLQDVAIASGAIEAYGPRFSVIDYYASWTEQAGHPVLNVQVNHATGDIVITQHRFNINTGYAANNLNYIVPITFASASNPNFSNTKPSFILSATSAALNRGSVGDEWVIFNVQQTGFYRVNYDDYTWDLITLALRGPQRTLIHEYNRAQIVNDVFQFARSGLMTYTRAFNILSFLEFETEYAPWVAALTGFSWIQNRFAGTTQLNDINNLLISWSATAINSLGYLPVEGEDFMRSYLRYQLAPVLCAMNVSACRQAATTQWLNLRNNNVEVPVDSRNWVYCNALRDGTVDDFDFLWQRFEAHPVYTEKILILQTIGCTPHETALNVFLDGIVQENELVRPQDYSTAFSTAVNGNEGNTQIVFRYIQNNYQTVSNAFGNIATPLSYISSRLRTQAEIIEFETWVEQNQALLGTAYATVLNGVNTARESIAWANAVSDDLNTFITNGFQDLTLSTPAPPAVIDETTVPQPPLIEPPTPVIPVADSAVTNIVSFIVVFMSLVGNVLL